MMTKNVAERASIVVFSVLAVSLCLSPLSANAQNNRNIGRTTQTQPTQSDPWEEYYRTPPTYPTGEEETQSGPGFGECVQTAVAVCGVGNVDSVTYDDGTCSFSCQGSVVEEQRSRGFR